MLFVWLLTVASDLTSSSIEVHHGQIPTMLRVGGVQLESRLSQLQSLQLLTYEKTPILTNRIEKNTIQNKRKEIDRPAKKIKAPIVSSETVSDSLSPSTPTKANLFIARYCSNFKLKYNSSIQLNGKLSGLMKNMAERLERSAIENFVDAYFGFPDPQVHKARHPIETMNYKFNEILIFANSGKFTPMSEVRGLEKRQSIIAVQEAIKSGENF